MAMDDPRLQETREGGELRLHRFSQESPKMITSTDEQSHSNPLNATVAGSRNRIRNLSDEHPQLLPPTNAIGLWFPMGIQCHGQQKVPNSRYQGNVYVSSVEHLPGTVSPLNFISTMWVRSSCGTKDARNRWLPRVRTELVTWPPLTRISRFPEPAPEPSTAPKQQALDSICQMILSKLHPHDAKYILTSCIHSILLPPMKNRSGTNAFSKIGQMNAFIWKNNQLLGKNSSWSFFETYSFTWLIFETRLLPDRSFIGGIGFLSMMFHLSLPDRVERA